MVKDKLTINLLQWFEMWIQVKRCITLQHMTPMLYSLY